MSSFPVRVGGWKSVTAAGLALAGLASAASAGPVTIVSQERRIAVSADNGFDDAITASSPAPDAGPFEGNASANVGGGDDALYRPAATMKSTIGDDGLFFAGTLEYEIRREAEGPIGRVSYELDIDVTFSVDRAYNFVLNDETRVVQSDPNAEGGGDLFFSRVDDPAAPGFPLTDDASGVLEPGTYRLSRSLGAESIGLAGETSSQEVEYELSLELSPVDGGGGETPIPLPPAVWAGLSVMGVGLLNRWRKSRLA